MTTAREYMNSQVANAMARFGCEVSQGGVTVDGIASRLQQTEVAQDPGLQETYTFSVTTRREAWTAGVPELGSLVNVLRPDASVELQELRILRLVPDSANLSVVFHLGTKYQPRERTRE